MFLQKTSRQTLFSIVLALSGCAGNQIKSPSVQEQVDKIRYDALNTPQARQDAEIRALIESSRASSREYEAQQEEQHKAERLQKERLQLRREAAAAEVQAELAKLPDVRIGMTADNVRSKTKWGTPDKINSTESNRTYAEQWVYEGKGYLYFRNGKLVTIQKSER